MPAVLWHEARCTCAEDLVGAAEDFGGGAEDFGGAGAAEELAVRALRILAVRALLVKHLACPQASLT